MRKSKIDTAETRRRIIKTASSEFRRNGIHATGLAELMGVAGLTHGGFYRHFDSKDQLVAEACADSMEAVVETAEAVVYDKDGRSALDAIADSYLTSRHRDSLSDGCPLAGLGSELARADHDTRAAATAGFVRFAEVVARQIRRSKPDAAKARAMYALSAMIGAVTMSRIMTDPELSASILLEAKRQLSKA